MSTRRVWLLIGIGAVLLVTSYPPFALVPLTPALSFIAVIPAVLLVAQFTADAGPRRAFKWGFWYGFASHSLVLYWLIVALWRFTKLSALGFLATVAIIALLHGVTFWFLVRVRLRLPRAPLWVVFPVAWTTLEWTIGHLGDIRFPWLGLGTSLADALVLAQWADIAGARGLTFWLAWCGAFMADGLTDGRSDGRTVGRSDGWLRWFGLRRIGPVAATIALAAVYGLWRMQTLPLRDVGVIGMVQPNVGYSEKWDAVRADGIVSDLMSLSIQVQAVSRPDLIIWPEAAIPGYVQGEPDWEQAIIRFARVGHTPLLAGGLYADLSTRERPYYNAAFLFDSTGDRTKQPIYGKHYLVPIVERVPFVPPRWFKGMTFFGGFSRGKDFPLFQVGVGRFGVAICYESIFESLARRYRRTGADFLVNMTNDAWYGLTSAPYQHESHLVLRAIETRMGVARAANSGISEFLDPLGRAFQSTKLEERTIVSGTLRTSDVVPLYVRLGDWVGVLVVVGTLAMAGVLVADRFRGR